MKRLLIALALACLAAVPMLAQQGRWEIVNAEYGAGNNWSDVTDRVRSLVQDNSLNMIVSGSALGETQRRGRNRSLRLQLRDASGNTRQVTYRDNQRVRLQVNNVYLTGLHITRATYAYGSRSLDVTSRLNSQIRGEQLRILVNNQSMGGDPAPGQNKTLLVNYSLDGQNLQTSVREGETLHLTHGNMDQGMLQINRATYGSAYRNADVTTRLNSQIQGNQVNLQVDNNTMGGDPSPGQSKTLTVEYALHGETNQVVINEGEMLRLNSSSSQNTLYINRGSYGSGYRSTDVTSRLNSQVQGNRLNLTVNNNSMGGDPAPNQAKALTVQYTLNGQTSQVVVNEGEMLRLNGSSASNSELQINRATYASGYRSLDVTARLNSQIQGNKLNLQVNNNTMGGDPAPGQAKTLTVQYAVSGQPNQVVVNEGNMLRLPYATESGLSQRFVCESGQSNNYGRKYCAANTNAEVRFLRQLGETACTRGSTWGYDNNGVWVDQGCRAEFEIQGNGRVTGSTFPATITNGTELSIRTNEAIDSSSANAGQTFSAVVATDVLDSSGAVIIPRGSDARLVIRSTEKGGMTSASELVLDVDSLTIAGTKYTVSTSDLEQKGGQGVGANRKTAIMVGGGAAIGTIIGAIVGGGKGAAIGAAIGAGGGLGTEILTKGKQVKVPAETLLNFRLDQDLQLQAAR